MHSERQYPMIPNESTPDWNALSKVTRTQFVRFTAEHFSYMIDMWWTRIITNPDRSNQEVVSKWYEVMDNSPKQKEDFFLFMLNHRNEYDSGPVTWQDIFSYAKYKMYSYEIMSSATYVWHDANR